MRFGRKKNGRSSHLSWSSLILASPTRTCYPAYSDTNAGLYWGSAKCQEYCYWMKWLHQRKIPKTVFRKLDQKHQSWQQTSRALWKPDRWIEASTYSPCLMNTSAMLFWSFFWRRARPCRLFYTSSSVLKSGQAIPSGQLTPIKKRVLYRARTIVVVDGVNVPITLSYTSRCYGLAERHIEINLSLARPSFKHPKLPIRYWDSAIKHVSDCKAL